MGKTLEVRARKEEYWDDIFGANDNSSDYFEKYLLTPDATPLVLAIDNFGRIFAHGEIETDVCGLLRSWHERARSPFPATQGQTHTRQGLCPALRG